jgi:hypothetical protein
MTPLHEDINETGKSISASAGHLLEREFGALCQRVAAALHDWAAVQRGECDPTYHLDAFARALDPVPEAVFDATADSVAGGNSEDRGLLAQPDKDDPWWRHPHRHRGPSVGGGTEECE